MAHQRTTSSHTSHHISQPSTSTAASTRRHELVGRLEAERSDARRKKLTPPPSPVPSKTTFEPQDMLPRPYHAGSEDTNGGSMSLRKLSRRASLRGTDRVQARKLALSVLVPTTVIILIMAGANLLGGFSLSNSLSNAVPPMEAANGAGLIADKTLRTEWHKRGNDAIPKRQHSTDSADLPIFSLGTDIPGVSGSPSTTPTPTTTANPGDNSGTSGTPTTTITTAPSIPANPVLPTPFVQPFDETLSADFISGTCQTFFANLTQSLSFRQCRPFSQLISSSQAFLHAQSNLTLLTSIVYGTCNTTPSQDECIGRMNGFAASLKTACTQELDAGQAFTWNALNGFKNYEMYRKAGCLRNLRTDSYCYVDAVAAVTPSDIYFWQLPLGTPLPGASDTSSAHTATSTSSSNSKYNVTPTCSACTQSLMAIYGEYASNSSLLISETYADAQRVVVDACGSGYATVASSGADSLLHQGQLWAMILFSSLAILVSLR